MKQIRKPLSILLVITMVLSLMVTFGGSVSAEGTVTVSFDTGKTYYRGDVAELTATTDITDITKVEFYNGTTLLGHDTTAPYTFNYINLPEGSHSITVKVIDSASNETTSDAVNLTVLPTPAGKTLIAGTDFSTYAGGFTTLNYVQLMAQKATATNTTSAPGRAGNNVVQYDCATQTSGENYRIYLTNIYTPLNTEHKKVEISMDMAFADTNDNGTDDFSVDRQFLKIWGGSNSAGANGTGTASIIPIVFKANRTITYYDGSNKTLKTDGNTGANNYTLDVDTWYNFKFVTWTDGTSRKWEFYINNEKAFDTLTMANSAPPVGGVNSLYYFRPNYVFANGGISSTLTSRTYFDNIYGYQGQDPTVVTTSINTPADGTLIGTGTPFALTATASTSDTSTIQKVEYYHNGQIIGQSSSAPYTVNLTPPAGSYSVVARAISTTGYSGYSAPVSITVDDALATPTPEPTPTPDTTPGPVSASILSTKTGAGSMITMVYDDGFINTAEYNDQMYAKYNLKGTTLIITNNVGSNLARFQAVAANGRVDYGSHSTTHAALTDNAAPDSVYQYELVDSKTTLETMFPGMDILGFAPSNNTMTTRGMDFVKSTYYAQRMGTRGFSNLNPSESEWYNIKMKGIGDVTTTAERNAWVDTAITGGNWLFEMYHGIAEGGYQPIPKADAESHYAYISQKQDEGKIWCASYTEAIKYLRERQVSTVEATYFNDAVDVNLTYPESALPTTIFDYPLTVKVEVPADWGMVTVDQGQQQTTATTFMDNGTNYANVPVVPNGGTAVLTDAGTSNKLTNIRLNGISIENFSPDTFAYSRLTEVAQLPITITAEPLDSQATITYTPAQTVTSVPTVVTIQVTDANGLEQDYTINFSYNLSTNNNLSSISVGGTNISNFNSATTTYNVMASTGDDNVTVTAVKADPTATVSYSPSATVTAPATVAINVTSETGAVKTYTVNVRSRNNDYEYLNDNFESYTLGQNITTGKWSAFNFGTTNGVLSAKDPLDDSNLVGQGYNYTGASQNQQLNKYLDKITEPVIVKGRYMQGATAVGSSLDIVIRGEGTNLINACNFTAAGDIKIGSFATADAKYVAGQWLDYVLVIKPASGKYQITGYFSGPAVRDTAGNPATVVVATRDSASNTNMNMANLDCRILVRSNAANGAGNEIYLDDNRIYIPGFFKVSMPQTTDVDATNGITVLANHDIAPATITKDTVVVQDSQGTPVALDSVVATQDSFTVQFADSLPGGNYTLSLTSAAKDAVGQSVSNTIGFSVLNLSEADLITGLTLNNPTNLNQVYGATGAVNFTASATPSTNIVRSTVVWYVNDVLQEGATGLSFNYQPTTVGDYVVTAKVSNNPDAIVESRTIHVEQADAVVTSWPTISKILVGQTFGAALGSNGVGDGIFTIEDADVVATAKPEGYQKIVTFTPNNSNYKAVQTTVTVTVKEPAQYLIDRVLLNTPENLNQISGSTGKVTFTATTEPATGVDIETIAWYVNGEIQPVVGTTFEFTPTAVGTYVISTAVSDNAQAVCDSRTVTVVRNETGDDEIVIEDDFAGYGTEGSPVVSGVKWSEVYNDATRGVTAVKDPSNENNLVAKYWSTSTSSNWPSMRKPVTLGKTIVFSGKTMIPTAETSTFYLNYRYSGATNTTTNILNFINDATCSIKAGSGNVIVGYWKPGEWIKYNVSVTPNSADPTKCQLNVTLSGGVTDINGNTVDLSFIAQSDLVVNLGTIGMANQTLLTNASIPGSSTAVVYLDDAKVYHPASLVTRIVNNTDVATNWSVTVYFNHDIDVTTLTKDKVIVEDAQQNAAAIASISVDPMNPSSFVIHFEPGALQAGKTYTVTLMGTVSDVAGFHPENSSSFSTVAQGGTIPAAPSVTANDIANTITGLELLTMEYAVSVDGITFGNYTNDVPVAFGGTKTVKVRVKAAGDIPAGLDTVLTFTPNAGDINGSGVIDIADLVMVAEIAVGYANYTAEQIARANVNSNEITTVDIADVVLILERIAEGSTTFPVEQ